MKARPVVHVIQGAVLLVVGVVLLFTPLYEWGWIITPLSAAFLIYGIVRMAMSLGAPSAPGAPGAPGVRPPALPPPLPPPLPTDRHDTLRSLIGLFLAGTLIASLASCGQDGAGSGGYVRDLSNAHIVRNSEFGFSIAVPADWQVDERPPVPRGSRVFRPLIEAVSPSNVRAVLQIRVGPKVPPEATSEAIAREMAQGIQSQNRSARVTYGTGRVSGQDVCWTDTVLPGENWRHRAYWLIVRGTVFEVAVSSLDSGFSKVEPLLTQIVESMQFD